LFANCIVILFLTTNYISSETFPLNEHILITKFGNHHTRIFEKAARAHKCHKLLMIQDFIRRTIIVIFGTAYSVLSYPVEYRYVTYAKNTFYFPARNTFDIQLKCFHHIVRIDTFAGFFYRKIVRAAFAVITLSVTYYATFYQLGTFAAGTFFCFHGYNIYIFSKTILNKQKSFRSLLSSHLL
jgi:hypothetical protein